MNDRPAEDAPTGRAQSISSERPFPVDALLGDVEQLFAALGGRMYAGEPVTQLEHALQSAWLAESAGAGPALVAAALLHDVGHLAHDLGETPTLRGVDDRHEVVAATWLAGAFGPDVSEPVRLHVEAKRYMCTRGDGHVDGDAYLRSLSDDSRRSLALQGGPHTPHEADAFEATPWWREAVALRRWDDAAKVADRPTPSLEHYLAVARSASRPMRAGG